MRRSKNDKVIAGVCGGIGKYTDVNPWVFRILSWRWILDIFIDVDIY